MCPHIDVSNYVLLIFNAIISSTHLLFVTLFRDKMMQKLLTHKIEFDRLSETAATSGSRTVQASKHRQRNMSQ